ncbi:MAG: DUF6786 family protein [Armatimonadota bacterium]
MITDTPVDKYRRLLDLTDALSLESDLGSSRLAICPMLGGRVFAEVCGETMHRIDLDVIANPLDTFNNYGGNVFWPAPEGGRFGFNYEGDTWRVQDAINIQPFEIVRSDTRSVLMEKTVELVNRADVTVKALMTRETQLSQRPDVFDGCNLKGFVSYTTLDSFDLLNEVTPNEALIAAWTLEQFDASDESVSFCAVANVQEAINFDFYDDPSERIAYFANGFSYRTNGRSVGQIGIAKRANPSFIGFYDLSRSLLCIRENLNVGDGLYFNIADNDQPRGPYSAADLYSIYNSGPEVRALELETVGSAITQDGLIRGSKLISRTSIGIFETATDIVELVAERIGM